jgi:hypothetical protein
MLNYKDFIKESKSDIENICYKYFIKNWTLNDDGSIDVEGNVDLHNENLKEIPLKFNRVSGYFKCGNNMLTSLWGSPKEVGGDFDCSDNQLTDLVGSPNEVVENFYCNYNKLTSLEGSPRLVGRNFICSNNQLTDLVGSTKSVGFNFYCGYNPIYSFKGLEDIIIRNYLDLPTHLGKVWELFLDKKEIETIMDYDPFRMVDGKPAIDIDRLNQFLQDIGKKPVEGVEGWISI